MTIWIASLTNLRPTYPCSDAIGTGFEFKIRLFFNLLSQRHKNEHNQIFFVVFFFLRNMVIINCFIKVALYNFKSIKEGETGERGMAKLERLWLRIKVQILQV